MHRMQVNVPDALLDPGSPVTVTGRLGTTLVQLAGDGGQETREVRR